MPSSDSWLWVFRAGLGLILLAGLLFMLGFATDHWHDDSNVHYGLWERCEGARCKTHDANDLSDYHITTQALQIVALFFFVMGPIVHFFVYLSKRYKDTGWRSRVFDISYILGAIFHLASVVVFGLEHPDSSDLSWSYRMSAAASPIVIAGILLVIISRSKALVKFRFLPTTKSKRKSKVNALVDSRSSTPQSYNGRRNVRSTIEHKQSLQNSNAAKPRNVTPGTSHEINVNINISPVAASGAAFSTQSSKLPYGSPGQPNHPVEQGGAYYHASTSSNPPDSGVVSINPLPYSGAADSTNIHGQQLTTVRPAPLSSQISQPDAHYQQRRTFGPSEKQRSLHPSESGGLRPIRGIPSAPPAEFHLPPAGSDDSPPSYMDAVESQNVSKTQGDAPHHSSDV